MGYIKECPKNEAEVIKSSNRLKCGTDDYGNNQYICVPNKDKSSLVELCYNGTMGLREKGNCVEESGRRLISYNCSKFRTGCPGENFDLNTIYKYPACQMINTELRCYVMDPSCKPGESIEGNDGTLLYLLLGGLVAVLIIAVIILYRTRESNRGCWKKCIKETDESKSTKDGSKQTTDESRQPKDENKLLLETDDSTQPTDENKLLLETDDSTQPTDGSKQPTDESRQPKDESKPQLQPEGRPNITTSKATDMKTKSVKLLGNVFVYDGSPKIEKVYWKKNGEKIDTKESGGKLSTVTVDDPSLTITNMNPDDAGEYQLFAENAEGTTFSDIIAIGVPKVDIKRPENEGSGSQCFIATIEAIPSPCSAKWSKKSNCEKDFKPIDPNEEGFIGTTNNLPHPRLEVRGKNLLQNHFQIEVSNFVGSTIANISGRPNIIISEKTNMKTKSVELVGNVFAYDGSPKIEEVYWKKNGEKIDTKESGGKLSTVTVDDPSLTITNMNPDDAGEYQRFAEKEEGTTSSDIIIIGVPKVDIKSSENEGSGSQCFKWTIEAIPSPCSAKWSKQSNDEIDFKPKHANEEGFIGTTNNLPHPSLEVRDKIFYKTTIFK